MHRYILFVLSIVLAVGLLGVCIAVKPEDAWHFAFAWMVNGKADPSNAVILFIRLIGIALAAWMAWLIGSAFVR